MTDFILLENGDRLLLENGDKLLNDNATASAGVLQPITPTTATVAQGTSSGIWFRALSGFTSGSTRTIADLGGATGIGFGMGGSTATGEQLSTTLTPLTPGTFTLVIREALNGETRDTPITVTVTPATLNDIIWTTPTIPDTTAVGTQVGYLTNGRTTGSTLELTDTDGGRFAMDSTGRVTVAASLIGFADARFIRVRETLAGATNSPKSTLAQINVTAPTLAALSVSPSSVLSTASVDSLVGTITGGSSNGVITIPAGMDDGGRFKIVSNQLRTAATLNDVVNTTRSITLRETRAGASNSPRDTVITVAVTEPYSGPAFLAAGSLSAGTTTTTPIAPNTTADGDFLLLFVETPNNAVTTPAGWTEVAASPQGTGTAGSTTSTRLTAYSKYAVSADYTTGVPLTGTADHIAATILRFPPDTQIDAAAGSVSTTASTAVTIPSVTTTGNHRLIVAAVTSEVDIATARFSGWTNGSLGNVTERFDASTTVGNGGGIGVATGEKTLAGATGTWSASAATSTRQGRIAIALKKTVATPAVSGTGSTTIPAVTGTASGKHGHSGTGFGLLATPVSTATGVHDVTGAASAILSASATATGGHGVRGTASTTLALPSATAAGSHAVVGTASTTLSLPTASAVGTYTPATITGTASTTLPTPTAVATGVHAVTGVASTNLGLIGQGLGVQAVMGSAVAYLDVLTASGNGITLPPGIAGYAHAVLSAPTADAASVHGHRAVGAAIVPAASADAVGYVVPSGFGAANLSAPTGTATGRHGVAGSATTSIASPSASSIGVHGHKGTASATIGLVASAAGQHGVKGTADVVLGFTALAYGTHGSGPATGYAILPGPSAHASGVHGNRATGSATTPSIVGVASGVHAANGDGVALLGLSADATGRHGHRGDGVATLTPLSALSIGRHAVTGAASIELGGLSSEGQGAHGVAGSAVVLLPGLIAEAFDLHFRGVATAIVGAATAYGRMWHVAPGYMSKSAIHIDPENRSIDIAPEVRNVDVFPEERCVDVVPEVRRIDIDPESRLIALDG